MLKHRPENGEFGSTFAPGDVLSCKGLSIFLVATFCLVAFIHVVFCDEKISTFVRLYDNLPLHGNFNCMQL